MVIGGTYEFAQRSSELKRHYLGLKIVPVVHAYEMADYGPTQEVVDGAYEEEEEKEEVIKAPDVWGRLLPLAPGFTACGGLRNAH